jgi:dTDP-4-dehydrorhamnose reductase
VRRVLLLGIDGLLGSSLSEKIANNDEFEVITTARKFPADFNFTYSPRALSELIVETRPDIVINCIAVTSIEARLSESLYVNAFLPLQLGSLSSRHKFSVIHFSTNAVFSGKNRLNSERTKPFPTSKYGITKFIGDFSSNRNMVLRTSFVGVSPHPLVKSGLLENLRKAPINDEILIQDNSIWNGLTTLALAEIISVILEHNQVIPGIFHLSSSTTMSRYQLVRALLDFLGRNDIGILITGGVSSNFSLATVKTSLISNWWSKTKYGGVPDFSSLIREFN